MHPTNPQFYTAPKPNYLPCSVEQAAALNLITLMDRSTPEDWARHYAYLLTIKADHAAVVTYCVQELTSLDQEEMRRDLAELTQGNI